MDKGRKPVPVTYNGITYESVYDCAAAFDLSANAVRWRLKHSLPLEAPFRSRMHCEVTYQGKVWYSLRLLAEAYGLSENTCRRRLKAGVPLDLPAVNGRRRPCEYGGRRYMTVASLARELKMPRYSAVALIETSGRWL